MKLQCEISIPSKSLLCCAVHLFRRNALYNTNEVIPSVNLKVIADVGRVFASLSSLACSLHTSLDVRVVFLGSAFLVFADSVAS